jgi:acetyl-CoA acetyltransferase
MAEFGSTEEHLGAVVQAATKHASTNPNALRGREVSIEDHLSEPYLTSPFRELDCFINPSVGACAVVVTTAERAQDLRQPPAHIAAAVSDVSGGPSPPNWEMWSFRQGPITGSAANRVGPKLWRESGMSPSDVDVAEIYDCYSYTVLSQLEAYGFCETGEAGPFVEGGRIEIGGQLPVNTHGGHLGEAYIHGFNHILEGVRQIRGTSTAQVEDARVALVTAGPGPLSSALLLTKEAA